MKERTLNQTWTLCLRMWRSISKKWVKDELNVDFLKKEWLRENKLSVFNTDSNCFFCDYAGDSCLICPGKLVNLLFSCMNHKYHCEDNPLAFYKELLRLNRIRKAKK